MKYYIKPEGEKIIEIYEGEPEEIIKLLKLLAEESEDEE